MDTGEARQACSVRAPPRNVQQRMHAGCDNSGKKVFSNLAKEVNRNMFIESAKVQQPLSGAVCHSRRHFSVIGQLSLTRKQTAGHFGFNELSLKGSGIPSNTFLINLPAVPVSKKSPPTCIASQPSYRDKSGLRTSAPSLFSIPMTSYDLGDKADSSNKYLRYLPPSRWVDKINPFSHRGISTCHSLSC